jgi:hypothetical protein
MLSDNCLIVELFAERVLHGLIKISPGVQSKYFIQVDAKHIVILNEKAAM